MNRRDFRRLGVTEQRMDWVHRVIEGLMRRVLEIPALRKRAEDAESKVDALLVYCHENVMKVVEKIGVIERLGFQIERLELMEKFYKTQCVELRANMDKLTVLLSERERRIEELKMMARVEEVVKQWNEMNGCGLPLTLPQEMVERFGVTQVTYDEERWSVFFSHEGTKGETAMSMERALEITADMSAHHFIAMGLRDGPGPDLSGYGLDEMVEATRVLVENRGKSSGKIHVTCDPRLVAALYVATHYEGEDPHGCEPVARVGDNGVFVLSLPSVKSENTQEE